VADWGARRGLAAGVATLIALLAAACGSGGTPTTAKVQAAVVAATTAASPSHHGDHGDDHGARRPARAADAAGPRYAVGIRTLVFVDHGRPIQLPHHRTESRRLVTVIRYPTAGPPSATDVRNAPPLHGPGPFPLVVFGHGFAVTPTAYANLLQSWARAGYVVAAPVFPLENANAPGGPDENDLVNQPGDMKFVITRMLAASADAHSPLAGTISPTRIAVTGQSDGAETALAVAYDRYYLDRRVRAAIILSGAILPPVRGFTFPAPSPPLLAAQGGADTINRPKYTLQFFGLAPRPKFLLWLPGAPHLPPYTHEQPQLSIVERVTTAFMDRYLKGESDAAARMTAAGRVPGTASLIARP
jgi:dienelactone hydrolase